MGWTGPVDAAVDEQRPRGADEPHAKTTALGHEWLRAPLFGVATEIGNEVPAPLGDVLLYFVGASGAVILVAAITTSISGFARLAYSLGEHGQLPRAFGRLHRRTLVS